MRRMGRTPAETAPVMRRRPRRATITTKRRRTTTMVTTVVTVFVRGTVPGRSSRDTAAVEASVGPGTRRRRGPTIIIVVIVVVVIVIRSVVVLDFAANHGLTPDDSVATFTRTGFDICN